MMNASSNSPQYVFPANRAEELGYDVWQYFVIPPFFPSLDLQTARKPRLIIGGRGCGKTMLLRYLSHQTMFSPVRPTIPDDTLSHIGLYWRTDTHFANAMHKRDIPEDTWHAAFAHMTALLLSIEVLKSLQSIALSKSPRLTQKDIMQLDFHRLKAFDSALPTSPKELADNLQERLWSFESWVNDVRKVEEPKFLPGQKFVLALIQEIQKRLSPLGESTYFVYLDEYENLRPYQKRIINTWLKHSEKPLIFNVAMKRNAFDTRETTGPESLSDIHDFRQHDLESYFLPQNSAVFFAEILFLQLTSTGFQNLPITASDLRDPSQLNKRQTPEYIKRVISAIETMFPDVSEEELARDVFQDPALSEKLRERIALALKQRNSKMSDIRFFRPKIPKASIVTPAILNRKKPEPEEVAKEMDKLQRGEENRFTGATNWIHNNFIGSLLQLYEPYSRPCPFYSGFRTFLQLSRGNIRHFLELCYKSINRVLSDGGGIEAPLPPSLQAQAARQASITFLGEVRSFGPHGHRLHMFVLRLGSLFALAHLRPTLSESEQSHFSIARGSQQLTPDDHNFLNEATKWSVLFEEEETKTKDHYTPQSMEYVLNPIYSPYFHISYRKKRKLELKTHDLICLIRGSYEDVTALLKKYSQSWSVEKREMPPSLFSHLTMEE